VVLPHAPPAAGCVDTGVADARPTP
jgi:hypothetical protein